MKKFFAILIVFLKVSSLYAAPIDDLAALFNNSGKIVREWEKDKSIDLYNMPFPSGFWPKFKPLASEIRYLRISSGGQMSFIPDVLDCPELLSLRIESVQLEEPPLLSKCPKLQKLDLQSNKLRMPPGFAGTPDLKEINLQNNALILFPKISECLALETLHIGRNQIVEVPALENFPNLRFVSLGENLLTHVPVVSNCPKLNYVQVEMNYIQEISLRPYEMGNGKPKNLRQLLGDLENFASLFPEEKRQAIINLYLSNREIDLASYGKLPEHFWELLTPLLKELQVLSIENCGVRLIPDLIGDAVNLYELHINGNPIKCLPQTMGNLQNTNFHIDESYLSLPSGLFWTKISPDNIHIVDKLFE